MVYLTMGKKTRVNCLKLIANSVLVPYLLWVSFAAILNISLFLLNR